jgi:hypothetical protein
MLRSSFWTGTIIVIVLIIGSISVTAGYGQDLEKGDAEATGQIGLVAGIGTHASIAGSVGSAVRERVFAFGEFSYIPLGGGTIEAFGFKSGGSAKALGFNFGGQYLFPKMGSLAPYAGGSLEILHSTVSYTATFQGTGVVGSSSGTDVYLGLGGGARYYTSGPWGVKPEVTLFVGPNTYVRFAAGLFYQFKR